jgi:hypothetical protein
LQSEWHSQFPHPKGDKGGEYGTCQVLSEDSVWERRKGMDLTIKAVEIGKSQNDKFNEFQVLFESIDLEMSAAR